MVIALVPALSGGLARAQGAPPGAPPSGPPPSGEPYAQPPAGEPYAQPPAGEPYAQPPAGEPYAQPPAGEPYAQPPPAPLPRPRERRGFLVSGGLGIGSFNVDSGGQSSDDFGGVAYRLGFGGLINPRLALGIDLWGWSSDQSDTLGPGVTVFQRNVGAWLRYWATERFWLEGGAGTARTGSSIDGDDVSYPGVSLLAALGYEVVSNDEWALDLELRATFGSYSSDDTGDFSTTGGALGLSFDWY